jgi:glycosyltransferase involved in cell wall biosynthesis
MSTVDVVVPCYNYARYLYTCVSSVLSQEGVAVRVLVIDDASSDETNRIGCELADRDSRVEFRRHRSNIGHISTYNEGLLEWATADYTVLLSADDILAPGALSRATQIMDGDQTIGMVYGAVVYFEHDTDVLGASTKKWDGSYNRFSGTDWIERRCRRGQNVISSPEVVVRGKVQQAVGGYRHELPHAGDLEMWLRIAARSNIAYVRGLPQAFYRVHSASMLRTKYRHHLADLSQRKAAFDAFTKFDACVTRGASRLSSIANRALAQEALWAACRAYDHNKVEESHATELVEFALGAYKYARSLPEYAALVRRQRIGPTICNRTQIFAASAIYRRVRNLVYRRQVRRFGS